MQKRLILAIMLLALCLSLFIIPAAAADAPAGYEYYTKFVITETQNDGEIACYYYADGEPYMVEGQTYYFSFDDGSGVGGPLVEFVAEYYDNVPDDSCVYIPYGIEFSTQGGNSYLIDYHEGSGIFVRYYPPASSSFIIYTKSDDTAGGATTDGTMIFGDVAKEVLSVIVSGVVGMAEALGKGLSLLVQYTFLTTAADGSVVLSAFGGLIVVFAGISLSMALCSFVVKFVCRFGK